MKRNLLIAAIAAAAMSTSAFAAELGADTSAQVGASANATTGSEGFSQLDANHDGQLSRSEAQANGRLSGQWSQLDADGNGRVDQSEFSAFESKVPNAAAPAGQPNGIGRPGASGTMPEPGAAPGAGMDSTPPGIRTNPGASGAAPGHM